MFNQKKVKELKKLVSNLTKSNQTFKIEAETAKERLSWYSAENKKLNISIGFLNDFIYSLKKENEELKKKRENNVRIQLIDKNKIYKGISFDFEFNFSDFDNIPLTIEHDNKIINIKELNTNE